MSGIDSSQDVEEFWESDPSLDSSNAEWPRLEDGTNLPLGTSYSCQRQKEQSGKWFDPSATTEDPRWRQRLKWIKKKYPDLQVIGGNVGVTAPGGYLLVSKGTTLPASHQATGDRSKIVGGSSLGRLFSNDHNVHDTAAILGGGPFPFATPLNLTNVPAFPSITAGSVDVSVAESETVHLLPGAYGRIVVGQGGRLVLRGYTAGTG